MNELLLAGKIEKTEREWYSKIGCRYRVENDYTLKVLVNTFF